MSSQSATPIENTNATTDLYRFGSTICILQCYARRGTPHASTQVARVYIADLKPADVTPMKYDSNDVCEEQTLSKFQ